MHVQPGSRVAAIGFLGIHRGLKGGEEIISPFAPPSLLRQKENSYAPQCHLPNVFSVGKFHGSCFMALATLANLLYKLCISSSIFKGLTKIDKYCSPGRCPSCNIKQRQRVVVQLYIGHHSRT